MLQQVCKSTKLENKPITTVGRLLALLTDCGDNCCNLFLNDVNKKQNEGEKKEFQNQPTFCGVNSRACVTNHLGQRWTEHVRFCSAVKLRRVASDGGWY